jgi:hypothetical protein
MKCDGCYPKNILRLPLLLPLVCVLPIYIIGVLNTQRFDVFVPSIGECGGKWYIQHAEASVLQEFSSAEGSAELSSGQCYVALDDYPLGELVRNPY